MIGQPSLLSNHSVKGVIGMKNKLTPPKRVMAAYLLPGIFWYTIIVFVPICLAIYYGFFEWPGGTNMTFIGFQNYVELFQDGTFWRAFGNNIYLTVLCIVGQLGFAFIFAIMLNLRRVRCKGLHRTLAFFPSVLSAVVIGFIWSMIYDYNYGILNSLLNALGMTSQVQDWLNNPDLALTLSSFPLIWQYIGYYMIIILSAFASIDPQIFEMAEIDGANGFQRAVKIALPLVKNTLIVCMTLCIAGNMKIFDHIYVMTGGGPGTKTTVMALYAYKTAFHSYKFGYASAMSILILILCLICIGGSRTLLLRLTREREAK